METGKRQWRELLFPTTGFVIMLALLSGLSIWQWQRGEEKSARWQEFAAASEKPALRIKAGNSDSLRNLPDYHRVALRGSYIDDHQVLLDNRPEQGRPGWHVLTPFRHDETGIVVLVDRGWLPKVQGELPDIGITTEQRVISGKLGNLPRPGLELEGGEASGGWPRIMQFPEVRDVATALRSAGIDGVVADRVIWLDETAGEGFVRDWKPAGMPPERHHAYSFQWLALALTLLVIYILLLRRWLRRTTGQSEQE